MIKVTIDMDDQWHLMTARPYHTSHHVVDHADNVQICGSKKCDTFRLNFTDNVLMRWVTWNLAWNFYSTYCIYVFTRTQIWACWTLNLWEEYRYGIGRIENRRVGNRIGKVKKGSCRPKVYEEFKFWSHWKLCWYWSFDSIPSTISHL